MKHSFHIKFTLLPLILMILLFFSCRDKLEIYEIERIGVFSFSTDNLNAQIADKVQFLKGKTIIYHYSPEQSETYTRFVMEVKGTNPAGNAYIINIEMDVIADGTYIGIYKPAYEPGTGGISGFTYLEEMGPNNFKSFNLDSTFFDEVFFRIERENAEEKLILGDFFARLQNDQDPNEKLIFYEGKFKDIYYGAN